MEQEFAESSDPFGLSDYVNLFTLITAQRSPSGEVGAAYRLNGSPMVLSSLVDGLPLCTLHLVVVGFEGKGLIARDARDAANFLGIVAQDGAQA